MGFSCRRSPSAGINCSLHWSSLLTQMRLERPLWGNTNAKLWQTGDFLSGVLPREGRGSHQTNSTKTVLLPAPTGTGRTPWCEHVPWDARTWSGKVQGFVLANSSPSRCFIRWVPACISSPRGFTLPKIFLFPVLGSQVQLILIDFIGRALILTPVKKRFWWEKQKQRQQQCLQHPRGWEEYSNVINLNLEDRDGYTSHLGWVQIKSFHFPLPKARCRCLTDRQRQQGLGWLMELPLPQLPLLCFESSYPLSIHSWGSTIYNRHLSHHPAPFALTITLSSVALRMLTTDKVLQQLHPGAKRATSHGPLLHCPGHPNQSFHLP